MNDPQTRAQVNAVIRRHAQKYLRYATVQAAYICGWIEYMLFDLRYDHPRDRENSLNQLDWGQALCREMYGIDWPAHLPEDGDIGPGAEERALSWACGEWPEWATQDRLLAIMAEVGAEEAGQ